MTSENKSKIDRRALLVGFGATVLLPGCANLEPIRYPRVLLSNALSPEPFAEPRRPEPAIDLGYEDPQSVYAAVVDEGFAIPAVPYQKIKPRFYRQRVVDPTGEAPGTLVVDTANRFLYLVLPRGEAMRYGVGIGREGFAWSGRAVVQWKRKWPTWTPPAEMIARDPKLEKYSAANGGQEPGLTNPLGARALYIFKDGQDTLYRLHGSPEWKSIGTAASSGCVRLMNQDVIDLYNRVPNKSPIVVLGSNSPLTYV